MLTIKDRKIIKEELIYMVITTFPHPEHYLLNYIWFILVNLVASGSICKEDAIYSVNNIVLMSYYEEMFKNKHNELHFTVRLVEILKKAKELGYWDKDYKTFYEELEQLINLYLYEETEGISETNRTGFTSLTSLTSLSSLSSFTSLTSLTSFTLFISKKQKEIIETLRYGLEHAEQFNLTMYECLYIYLNILDAEHTIQTTFPKKILEYFTIFKSYMTQVSTS